MTKNISYLVTLLLLLSFRLAYSQQEFLEAEVITQNIDTLKGYIQVSSDNQYSFAEELNQTIKTLSPNKIKRIELKDSRVFESKKIELNDTVSIVFLQLLAEGKNKLYKLINKKEYTYWTEDNNGKMYSLSNEKLASHRNGKHYVRYTNIYKGVLKNIFIDQPELFTSIDKLKYNDAMLINIYKQYHELANQPIEVYYKKRKDVALVWGIMAGIQTTSLKFVGTRVMHERLTPSFSKSNNLSLGFFIEERLLALDKRSSFRLEAIYFNTSHTNGNFSVSMSNLKIPISYKYLITPDSRIKPFVSIGFGPNFFINVKDKSRINEFDENWFKIGKIQYGFDASTGFELGKRLQFIFRYSLYNGNHITYSSEYLPGLGYYRGKDAYKSISKSLSLNAEFKF